MIYEGDVLRIHQVTVINKGFQFKASVNVNIGIKRNAQVKVYHS